jgi:PAS domain S-box-containing protein
MLRILHLENDAIDCEVVLNCLGDAGLQAESQRVETLPAFRECLETGGFGVILSDFTVPGLDPFEALGLAHRLRPEVPFIFVSGTIPEDQAIETLKLGASDYVLKQRLGRLAPSVKRALREADDQSRRKLAEAALRISEARLNAIISSAMDAILSIGADQRIVLFNRAAQEMFRISAREAVGQPIDRFIPSRFREAHGHHVAEFGSSGVSSRSMGNLGTLSALRANGDEFPIEASISQVEIGGVRLFTVILRDVTARQETEQALRESEQRFRQLADALEKTVTERTAQLLEANANLQTFTYTAAHDLRSPLRAIKSFSSFALEECAAQLGTNGRSYLEHVVQSAGQMQHLLNDLLEYSKVNQGELNPARIDLNTAVGEALKLQEPEIRARNAEVRVINSMPPAFGHPATVILIINNFLSNALKFVAPGVKPRITIGADLVQDEPERSSIPQPSTTNHQPPTASRRYVRLRVEDNGIGIPVEDLNKLFDAFHRLHRKQEYPGTGLGLAIVRRGAERMGGRVGVDSEPGKGSRFWVELRAAEQPAEHKIESLS